METSYTDQASYQKQRKGFKLLHSTPNFE